MDTKLSSRIASRVAYALGGAKFSYSLRYYHQRGAFPNLKKPHNLSEHILSDMFSPEFVRFAEFADKVLVRDYIFKKGLSNILLTHYGVWDKPEDIDFDFLPEKFILKSNNGTGGHVICKDKALLDKSSAISTLNASIKRGMNNPEPHYRSIVPKVFAEELIDTGSDAFPTDYKFTCINGEICDIFVATERERSSRYITFDLNWNILPYTKPEYLPKILPAKPTHLDEMVRIAKILSADFKFVRVDLYEYRNRVYFSELTFSPWGGLMYSYTDEAINLLGEKF